MIKPSYYQLIRDYNKILYQRNNLLKTLRNDTTNYETLAIWDEQIIQIGKKIIVCEYCGRIMVDPEIAGVEE